MVHCYKCMLQVSTKKVIYDGKQWYFCDNCLEYFFQCEDCKEYVLLHRSFIGNNYYINGRYKLNDKLYCKVCFDTHLVKCVECNDMIKYKDSYEDDNGELLCEDCYEDRDITCCSCNCKEKKDDIIEYEGDFYCEDCFYEKHGKCADCGDYFLLDDLQLGTDNDCYCECCFDRNFYTCYNCNKVLDNDSVYYNGMSDAYCEECYRELYTLCENCNSEVYYEDTQWSEISGMDICGDCYNNENNENIVDLGDSDNISFYNYHRTEKDRPDKKDRIYYGIELERSNVIDLHNIISDMKQDDKTDYYFQNECSVVNGIELTFQPRTLLSWYDYSLHDIINNLKDSNNINAGIHIHRSNKDITTLTKVKIIAFFVKCKDDIVKLADRQVKFATYDNYCTKSTCNVIYKKVKANHILDKYSAVNFAHKHTIEFRIFNSTLDIKKIYSYIEFCHYVIKFLKTESILNIMQANSKAVWYSFITWLQGENSQFLLNLIAK